MNKYSVSINIPMVTMEVHEVIVEAVSQEMAMIAVQMENEYTPESYVKDKGERLPMKGPYQLNSCRMLVNEEHVLDE